MSEPAAPAAEERVLVLAPTPRDAARTLDVLASAAVAAVACPDLDALCRGMTAGAAAAVLTEEAVLADRAGALAAAVRGQPPWSDLPLVVLTGGGTDSAAAAVALETLGNVTLLDRPVRVATLVSAVRAALRSRRKQYEVRDHLAERARAAAALEAAARQKDEFLATLAHELRNPLAPIRNALEIIRMVGGSPPVERNRALIERQVDQLVRLVEDLLDVSRVVRGKITLRRERVDLAAVAAQAVETAQPLIDTQGHALVVALPAEPVPVDADPLRLVQVVSNLLTNAAKYMERGGHIRLAVGDEGGAAVVRVRDSGIGIAPELLPYVFDLFVQADHSAARSQGGLGIGLTLVKSLVEMHGGEVEARSEGLGRGSEFLFSLPWQGSAPSPAAVEPRPVTPSNQPLRVLVVEDSADAAETLKDLLEISGHEAVVARTGRAGVEAARAWRPDVVLCDLGLPEMDGFQVAAALRREPALGTTRLIAISGYGQEDDQRHCREAGFDLHLVKPVDFAELEAVLRGTVA